MLLHLLKQVNLCFAHSSAILSCTYVCMHIVMSMAGIVVDREYLGSMVGIGDTHGG